ncbi:MAG: GatB/YqeY domain-containing protein [Planctomycetes bacterium]|nr:GatB/YqeY domain-containing protein [Planctomycetota bacterium]
MPLRTRIEADLKEAMKSRNDLVRDTLRLVSSELKNQAIKLRESGKELDEAEQLAVLVRCVKQRRDSVEQYEAAGRPELAAREQAEIDVIEGYLPKALGADELRAAVQEAIAETGATSMKDMGAVMKVLMAKHKGRVEGKAAQGIVGELLRG